MEKKLNLSKEAFCDALTLRREIDKYGHIRWYNADGYYHRNDGPAVEYANGRKEWYSNGFLHRDDGPAVIQADGTKVWYLNGKEVEPF